jgi:outer membrane protein OmpA-like peptidoglycan-associated protein
MRSLLLLLSLVAACHAAPVRDPLIAQHATPPAATAKHVEVESPAWVPSSRGRTVVTDTSITILDDLEFMPNSASFKPGTTPMLDAFAQTMIGNPSLQLITVRIFAEDVTPHWRRIIADLRARNVIDYVVAHGVARARLRPEGIPLPPPGVKARMQFEIVVRGP